MSYYCSVCDKTIKFNFKNESFKSLTQKESEKLVRINHTFQNPNFFDIHKIFNDCLTNHITNLRYILLELILN